MKVHIARYPNALNHCRPITVGIPLSRPKTPSSWVYPRARKAASIYEQIKRLLPNVIRRRRIFLFPEKECAQPVYE
jgi:predicted nucleic acid-binding Zn ribbon protein